MQFASCSQSVVVLLVDASRLDGAFGCLCDVRFKHRARVATYIRSLVYRLTGFLSETGDTIIGGKLTRCAEVLEVIRKDDQGCGIYDADSLNGVQMNVRLLEFVITSDEFPYLALALCNALFKGSDALVRITQYECNRLALGSRSLQLLYSDELRCLLLLKLASVQ